MIKHLIFDFGGVFLDLGGKHTGVPIQLSEIFNIPKQQAEEIWQAHKEELIIGKETPKEFLLRMNDFLGISLDLDKTHEDWKRLNIMEKKQIDWALVEFVESLKNNYKVHMLSNVIDLDSGNSEWFDSVGKQFDTIHKSHDIGHKKPNKEAYLHVLERIGAKPEECVFIDDLQINIDAANELGIKGILYTNFNQLKKDFIELEI